MGSQEDEQSDYQDVKIDFSTWAELDTRAQGIQKTNPWRQSAVPWHAVPSMVLVVLHRSPLFRTDAFYRFQRCEGLIPVGVVDVGLKVRVRAVSQMYPI